MSHYVECKPGFKDREALIEALVAVGFGRDQIEVHEQAAPLYGYRGDERPQRAHIVVRREHIGPAASVRTARSSCASPVTAIVPGQLEERATCNSLRINTDGVFGKDSCELARPGHRHESVSRGRFCSSGASRCDEGTMAPP